MYIAIVCKKNKSGKLYKGAFYFDSKDKIHALTFDKFAIATMLGGMGEYMKLKEGDEILLDFVLAEKLVEVK